MVASIVQVLLIKDAEAYGDLSPVLWAALEEVAAFYNSGAPLAEFRRAYLSVEPPPPEMADGVGENWVQLPENFWEEAQGTYNRTLDPAQVCGASRRLLEHELGLLIVTDQEVTPHPGLRYNIWRSCSGGGGLVSAAPTDPHYWGQPSRDAQQGRAAIIKHRVRTASFSVVGTMLGLERCDNDHCFLFQPVDSVLQLDSMVSLGYEHDLPRLAGRGYLVRTPNPAEVQAIVDYPPPEYALA
jgi:hypothetical protein